MASTLSAARSAAPAARSSVRARKRRKVTRPPQPRVPEDLFSAEAQAFLSDLLAQRAKSWKNDWMQPVYYYGRDSEPLWGEDAVRRISGTTLRIAGRLVLCQGLCMDLERGLRLLTLAWAGKKKTTDGHTSDEWRVALAGVLWRLGQHYREFTRRWGEEQTREMLRLAMNTLWK
ncbi:MAG TPA: hypothetical protein VKT82_00425 [Ktedonobacterales bacterium]|nr:hypothetical protein [Ktedonobacterales bacterium]